MGAQSLTLLTLIQEDNEIIIKRNNLFWLNEKGTDIVFPQETYWTKTCLKIKEMWDGQIILDHGTEHRSNVIQERTSYLYKYSKK